MGGRGRIVGRRGSVVHVLSIIIAIIIVGSCGPDSRSNRGWRGWKSRRPSRHSGKPKKRHWGDGHTWSHRRSGVCSGRATNLKNVLGDIDVDAREHGVKLIRNQAGSTVGDSNAKGQGKLGNRNIERLTSGIPNSVLEAFDGLLHTLLLPLTATHRRTALKRKTKHKS